MRQRNERWQQGTVDVANPKVQSLMPKDRNRNISWSRKRKTLPFLFLSTHALNGVDANLSQGGSTFFIVHGCKYPSRNISPDKPMNNLPSVFFISLA